MARPCLTWRRGWSLASRGAWGIDIPFDGTPITSDPIETVLQALEQRVGVAAASAFAPDGRLVDPQFPASGHRGRERVRAALEWSFANLAARPGFEIRLFLEVVGTCELEVESRRAGGAVRPFAEGVRRRARGRRNHGWRTDLFRTPDEASRTGGEPRR